jgi:hypothetical protein
MSATFPGCLCSRFHIKLMVHARRCNGIEAFLIVVRFCKGYRNDSNIIDYLCQRPSTLTKDIVEAPKRSQVTNAITCPLLPISMQTMQNTLLQLQLQLVIMQDTCDTCFLRSLVKSAIKQTVPVSYRQCTQLCRSIDRGKLTTR